MKALTSSLRDGVMPMHALAHQLNDVNGVIFQMGTRIKHFMAALSGCSVIAMIALSVANDQQQMMPTASAGPAMTTGATSTQMAPPKPAHRARSSLAHSGEKCGRSIRNTSGGAVKNLGRRVSRFAVVGAAAIGLGVTPAAAFSLVAPQAHADNCYNGVLPGNPYAANCSLPQHHGEIRGSAPDAEAIIACRDSPGCLSWYVNNPH